MVPVRVPHGQDDLKQGNYVDLLEPDAYYTVESPHRVRRQRINDNLLGDRRFCPTIRRTEILRGFEAADLPLRLRGIASRYAPMLLRRALGYLYAKETKSSFEIEHITPTSTRTELFEMELPARSSSAPISYLADGRQYIVLAVGGGADREQLVALALP